MSTEYKDHIKRKDKANTAKNENKLLAINDNSFKIVTFDLQSVSQLLAPKVQQMN